MAVTKIARGTTEQVSVTFNETQSEYFSNCDRSPSWVISDRNNVAITYNPIDEFYRRDYDDDTDYGYRVESVGDNILSVTIPADAPEGSNYYAKYDDNCIVEGGGGVGTYRRRYANFEVVCMTTKITVVETYRDEDKYRLSCTATPQGGTAPYAYNWSSSINGSQALSALNQATLEIEIPAIGIGSISVAVSDSSDPVCTASASFDVCGYVTCEFTTALISTPPTGDTEPYIYECVSSSLSGFGDLVHEWSPEPIEVSADGKVARFSFPDDDEHSIDLSVEDASGCRGFKTHQVGGYEFIVSTNPSGEDMGTVSGTRASMEFDVTVTAEATGNFVGPPPATLTLEFSRPAINGVGTATAPLVAGSNPARYQVVWRVTREKGRWQFKALGVRSNTVTFKIDKRKQIVEVAQSWVGAAQRGFEETPPQPPNYHGGDLCDDFARYVYGYAGMAITNAGTSVPDLKNAMSGSQDGDKGSIWFYHQVNNPNDWRHNGINVGSNQTVDQNCGHPHSLYQGAQVPTVNAHAADDPNLVNAQKYAIPVALAPTELQQLDAE